MVNRLLVMSILQYNKREASQAMSLVDKSVQLVENIDHPLNRERF